jgi:hypothetical protein
LISGFILFRRPPVLRDRRPLIDYQCALFIPGLPVVRPSVVASGIPIGIVVGVKLNGTVFQFILGILMVIIWI